MVQAMELVEAMGLQEGFMTPSWVVFSFCFDFEQFSIV
jgi:hypothetical protein